MRKFLASLSGEPSPKAPPKERIDVFKALINDLETIVRSESTSGGDNRSLCVCFPSLLFLLTLLLPFFRIAPRRSDNVFIPAILNKMIQLLLEEEREAEAQQEGTAPCIEFFLQTRILERLCNLASINKPVGMFQWIINAIARIIQHMKSPLLAHSSMHKPLVRLLSIKPNKLSFEEKIEILKLINALAHKLKEAPIFVKLFWSSLAPGIRSPDQASSPTMASSPLNSPVFSSPLEAHSPIHAPKRHFVLFKILDRIYRGSSGDRRLAEQVRRCILSCIVIDESYMELQSYLARQHKFLGHTVNEISKLYATLSRETYNGNPNSNGYLQEYFRQLQFCSALCKIDVGRSDELPLDRHVVLEGPSFEYSHIVPKDVTQSPPGEFSEQLAATLKKKFFEGILMPGLLSDDPKLSNIHTIFTRETLSQLDSPELMGALITCLVGVNDNSAGIEDFLDDPLTEKQGNTVQEVLTSRIEYKPLVYPLDTTAKRHALLAANTMRLWSTLCHIHPHNLYVTHHLIFQNLPVVANPDSHLRWFRHPTEMEELNPSQYKHGVDRHWLMLASVESARKALVDLAPDPPNVGQRVETLLELAPLARQTRDSGARPDVQSYHDYTKLRFKISRPNLLLWSANSHTPERKFPPPFFPEQKSSESGLHAVHDQEGDEQLVARRHVEMTHIPATLPPIPKDYDATKAVKARRFLRVLLANLEHFLELPLDFALYLTDTIASIIQYPHIFIHKWAYHASPSNEATLFETIQAISTKAIAFIDASSNRLTKILAFKESSEKKDSQEGQFEMSEDDRTVQNIVLLDEFCKELLAILLVVDQVLS